MAETKAPRRLDEALRPGGLYYTKDGTPHDAHGQILEGAPKRPEDTKPEDQPYARMVAASTVGAGGAPVGLPFDVNALGMAIGRGLQLASEGKIDEPKANVDNQAARDELASGLSEDTKPKQGVIADIRPLPVGVLPEDPSTASKPTLAPSGTGEGGEAPPAGSEEEKP